MCHVFKNTWPLWSIFGIGKFLLKFDGLYLISVPLLTIFFFQGLTFAIPGPLSPVPPSELSHDKSLMTYEVMYRCQGFMIGAMFGTYYSRSINSLSRSFVCSSQITLNYFLIPGARLLDRFNRLFLVFLALLVTALLVTIIPWCGNVWLLRTDMFLLGVSLGFLSTGMSKLYWEKIFMLQFYIIKNVTCPNNF